MRQLRRKHRRKFCVRAGTNGQEYGQRGGATLRDPVNSEGLVEWVSRRKHRWLRRVMYDPQVSSTETRLAFIVVDHLNCVTLDAWPSQSRIAAGLGRESIKTVSRAALGLVKRGYLRVTRGVQGSCRYAPIFLPEDEDKIVVSRRQKCPTEPDKNVEESYLGIPLSESYPTAAANGAVGKRSDRGEAVYDRRQRGRYETEVARLLGNGGFEILARLSEYDDAWIERLCRAYAKGELGPREVDAARLAASQLPKRRRLT
jgi:hypothetical protein